MATRRKDSKGKVLREGESERKDGRYVYRYTDVLGKRHCIYATNLNELRDKEKDVQANSNLMLDVGNMKFCDYIKDWIEMRPNNKYNTLRAYNNSLGFISQKELGNMRIKDITTFHIKHFCLNLVNEGYKHETIKQRYNFMRMIFEDAVENKVIKENPCSFKLKMISRPEEKEVKFLTKAEEEVFMNFCKSDMVGKRYYFLFKFLLNTGVRFGECAGLTWNDVDCKEKTITISRQLMGQTRSGFTLTEPKTPNSNRIIYLSNEFFEELMEYKKSPRPKIEPILEGHSNFIFLSTNGGFLYNANVNTVLKKLQLNCEKQTQIKLPILTVHLFRHTFCSRLIEQDVPVKVVQYTMGHSNISTTMNIYTHLELDTIKENMQKIKCI